MDNIRERRKAVQARIVEQKKHRRKNRAPLWGALGFLMAFSVSEQFTVGSVIVASVGLCLLLQAALSMDVE
jgi:hypothetical protein